jgi:hypothetical protein
VIEEAENGAEKRAKDTRMVGGVVKSRGCERRDVPGHLLAVYDRHLEGSK